MKSVLLLIGDGQLVDFVYRELSEKYTLLQQTNVPAEIPKQTELILVLQEGWNPSVHQHIENISKQTGIPWLRAFISFGEAIIGPFVSSNGSGCSQCADIRRLMAGRDRYEMKNIQYRIETNGGILRDVTVSPQGLLHIAIVICQEVEKIMYGNVSTLKEHIMIINMKTLNTTKHSFLPDPSCQFCSELPNDSATLAEISLQTSPKIAHDSYRSRTIEELKEFLVPDYLDTKIGFLNNKMIDLIPPFADVSVNLPLFIGDEGAAGRTNSYATSELTAILEGLERYCGMQPRSKKTVVYDSYRNIKDKAINPYDFGVHSKEQYEQKGFPFKPFNPNDPIDWVWGYSFLQKRSVLVPELLAYYSLGCGEGFVYETSNGCALGGSLEEAIFYGIMEVIERDAFLLTWYAKLSLPRIDPYSTNDKELKMMIDRARVVAGYDIYLYNATMEHGIPSVWTMAKNRKNKGMNIICAAGAHLDPIKAAKSAIYELAGMMLTLDDKFEKGYEKYEKMLHDASLVREMEDHGMLFGLPQAEERLHFLLHEDPPLLTFAESFRTQPKRGDLKEDLQEVLLSLHELNLDVIVVDQTAPEIKRNGLYCVKVIIPGMLPMTFGHHLTRVTGLERVLNVPMKLGFTKQPLHFEQLNPYPHPFP